MLLTDVVAVFLEQRDVGDVAQRGREPARELEVAVADIGACQRADLEADHHAALVVDDRSGFVDFDHHPGVHGAHQQDGGVGIVVTASMIGSSG